MKHIIYRKWLSVFMTMILLFTLPVNGRADSPQTRSDPYFLAYGIGMGTSPVGSLHMYFSVTAKTDMEMIGVSFYRVQRKVNGSWANVTDYIEGHLNLNCVTCQFGRNFTEAVIGVTYRVYARLYIRTFSGIVSTIDYYSQSYTLGT